MCYNSNWPGVLPFWEAERELSPNPLNLIWVMPAEEGNIPFPASLG